MTREEWKKKQTVSHRVQATVQKLFCSFSSFEEKRSLGESVDYYYTTPPTSPSPPAPRSLPYGYCGCDNFCARNGKQKILVTPPDESASKDKTKCADHLVTTLFDHLYDLAMSCCALVLDYCYAEMYKKKKYFKSVRVAFI